MFNGDAGRLMTISIPLVYPVGLEIYVHTGYWECEEGSSYSADTSAYRAIVLPRAKHLRLRALSISTDNAMAAARTLRIGQSLFGVLLLPGR
jgi:hypothetical protein